MEELKNSKNHSRETFEEIKHIDESGIEYWYARELMRVLKYNKWENFVRVIAKNGGTMPEDLPTPKKSLKQLEKESKNELKV